MTAAVQRRMRSATAQQNRASASARRIIHPTASTPTPVVQAKLRIGAPNDRFEQEADRMADMVMRMQETAADAANDRDVLAAHGTVQRKCAACSSGGGSCPECTEEPQIRRQPIEEEEVELQMKVAPGNVPRLNPHAEASIHTLRGGGRRLSIDERRFFEPRFGCDFGDVRIHNGARAAETAREVSAKAFTIGADVAFGAGEYQPGSSNGRRLLAHELTHVIQQRTAAPMSHRHQPSGMKFLPISRERPGRLQRKPDVDFAVFPLKRKAGGQLADPDQTVIPGGVTWPLSYSITYPLDADAKVRVTGVPGDPCDQFELGFLQTVHSNKFEADYVGQRRGHGSMLVKIDVANLPIRDGERATFWYERSSNATPSGCGVDVEPHIGDYPLINEISKVRYNASTGQDNYLVMIKRVLGFVTTLVAHSAATGVRPLRFFTWSYQMGISFTPNFTNAAAEWPFKWIENSTTLGKVFAGQHPEVTLFTTASTPYNASLTENPIESTTP